jgi:glycosyltransferase involved in cell wall biosynthesis
VSSDAAELAVMGFDGTYYYQWPMVRAVVEASRVVAAHSPGVAAELTTEFPAHAIDAIALGEGRAVPVTDDRRRGVRAALQLTPDAICFGVFGALTADKRLPQILRAFRTTLARHPGARLLLAGTPSPDVDLRALAHTLQIDRATFLVEAPDDEQFDELIAAVDVGIHLRWPTARETSGPWVRALAAGRPTIVTDLAHQAHLPTLDPRTWTPHAPRGTGAADEAIAVAVDLADEEHSLRAAMHRLAIDGPLRDRLGHAARRHWERWHTIDRMVADYERVLDRAAAMPAASGALPPGLRPRFLADVMETARAAVPGVTCDWPVGLVSGA